MWILAAGSAVAQSCANPPLTRCYDTIVMQTGQYAPNSPPKSARFLCNNGTNESFATYSIRNTQCPPAAESRSCVECASPIDLATGDTYITETDIINPGLGGGLT